MTRYTGLGCSYELEQPVDVHLDHDDVLASGDGCVYVHEPFVGLRKGLYLFNWHGGASTPGIGAVEGFVRFDAFDRPQFVSGDEATHIYWVSPADDVWLFQEYEEAQQMVKFGHNIPVERKAAPPVDGDTECVNLRDFSYGPRRWSESDLARYIRDHADELKRLAEREQRKEEWL